MLTSLLLSLVVAWHVPFGLTSSEADLRPALDALWQGAACGGPRSGGDGHRLADEAIVKSHCEALRRVSDDWREGWYRAAAPFFADIVPVDVPKRVVYPFGGADLLTALTIFPDADEITILALEPGGDPRSLARSRPADLARDLRLVRQHYQFLAHIGFSRTVDLDELSKGLLAGVLIYDLAALQVLGYEPVRLRLFTLTPSGGRLYRTGPDLDRIDARLKTIRSARARTAVIAKEFGNFELELRRRPTPGDPHPKLQVFRHLACDLSDGGLRDQPEVLAYLEGRGRVSVLTKAASYLLWHQAFRTLRGYLLGHLAWMVSDTSGLAPDTVDPALFEQLTWGQFQGPIITHPKDRAAKMEALFADNPQRDLPIAFGYPDKHDHYGLLVTRRRSSPAPR